MEEARVAPEEFDEEGIDVRGHLLLVVHGDTVGEAVHVWVWVGVEGVKQQLNPVLQSTSARMIDTYKHTRSAYPVPAGWSR